MKKVILLGALLASSFTFGQNIDWSTISENKVSETILQQENQMSAWTDYSNFIKQGGSTKKVKRTYKPFTEFEGFTLESDSKTQTGSNVYIQRTYKSRFKTSKGYMWVTVGYLNGKESSRVIQYYNF